MDKLPATPTPTLLDAALDAAKALGLTAQVVQHDAQLGRARADALVRIGRGDQGDEGALYAVETKRGLRPATLGGTLHHMQRLGQQALLVTDYLTPALADEMRARRVAFIDAAGNAYLEQPGLLVWVNGRKPPTKPIAEKVGRAFQPTGLQVIFALLCDPDAVKLPYRELADRAQVAHGTVGWVIPDLQGAGFIGDIKGKRGTRRLFEPQRLLKQWVDTYARLLRPRTLIGRYYVPTLQGWKDWPLQEHGAIWGGEPAGALLTNYLRPGELTIYADKLPVMLAARQKLTKYAEPGRTAVVEVRRRFWNFPGDPAYPELTPAVLTYADLLATGDGRCIETANMVYENHLARLFEKF